MSDIERLENDPEAAELILHGQDGQTRRIAHALLRVSCRCAYCRSDQLRGRPPVVATDIRLVGIHPMGYGVQLSFSDGHNHGIFPMTYLAELSSVG